MKPFATKLMLPLFSMLLAFNSQSATSEHKAENNNKSPTTKIQNIPLKGDYFGAQATEQLAMFAPGIISQEFQELNAAFSPDGNTFLWTIANPTRQHYTIMQYERHNDIWSEPKVAEFSGKYSDADPVFSPDGNRIYFISKRPIVDGQPELNNFDIWYVQRNKQSWSSPQRLSNTVNTDRNEYYISVTSKGELVYSSDYEGGFGSNDIYMATPQGDDFLVENLGDAINSQYSEGDPYINAEGNLLLFTVWGHPENLGGGDIYVSFKQGKKWSKAQNLGAPFNTSDNEYCPILSPDGKYFFLTSYRSSSLVSQQQKTYQDYLNQLNSFDNGLGNIFWVKSSVLEKFRPVAKQ